MKVTYNFYIMRTGTTRGEEKPIWLYLRTGGIDGTKTLTLNTGERILPKYWDSKAQKIKTAYTGSPELNRFLEHFKLKVQSIVRTAFVENDNLTFEQLKEIIRETLAGKPKYNFESVYNDYMQIKQATTSPALQTKLKTILRHLQSYDSELQLDNINSLYLQKFVNHLISKEMTNSYIANVLQIFRGFLNWAYDNDYIKNDSFKKFKNVGKATDPKFALNTKDLQKILAVSLPERLERVRDLFLFQLYTGQRFSDVQRFEYSDVTDNVWVLRQKKTSTTVRVPLIDPAIRIIEKYNYVLPTITNQKMNEYLKEIAVIAELTDEVTICREIGKDRIESKQSKAELLSSHTARRTVITMLTNGKVSETLIKSVSGHSSDKMLNQYYDRSDTTATKQALENVLNFADFI